MAIPDRGTAAARDFTKGAVMSAKQVVIFGANGGLGRALVEVYANEPEVDLHAVSRSAPSEALNGLAHVTCHQADLLEEEQLKALAATLTAPDLVIVATGLLSDGTRLRPEKTLRQQSLPAFEEVFAANTFGPALVAKHLLPRMPRDRPVTFAALSARVGSIADNGLGGWHAYRASKAALNMLIKCYAIEMARLNPEACCIGLHPGTVETELSAPFRGNVQPDKLFTPHHSATCLKSVISRRNAVDSGKVFDWAGKEIPA